MKAHVGDDGRRVDFGIYVKVQEVRVGLCEHRMAYATTMV